MEIKYTLGIATTKNEKGLIQKMLTTLKEDLLTSKIKSFEIIICLNNYDSDSEKELKKISKDNPFLNIRIVKSLPGLIPAQKKIINSSKSTKDFVIFYDSDIYIKKGTTKRFIEFMDKNPKVLVGTGDQETYCLKKFWYNIYNIVGLNPQIMTSRRYIIGKDFAIRKNKYFVPKPMVSDDTFLSHTIVYNYGKDALKIVPGTLVKYVGPKKFKDYYNKIRRLVLEKEKMFNLFPKYAELENYFKKSWIKKEIKKLNFKEKINLFLQKRITWICFKTAKLSKSEIWVPLNSTKDKRIFYTNEQK